MARELKLSIPPKLATRLESAHVSTLADILVAGGLANLGRLPVSPEHPAVEALDRHARLSVLPVDLDENVLLAGAGFTGIRDMAEAPLAEVVARLGEDNRDLAARVKAAADVQSRLIGGVTSSQLIAGNGTGSSSQAATMACNCEDCQSATSPLAYLADLLNYAVGHLKRNRGLRGQYYDTPSFKVWKLTRTDPTVDFDWGDESPDPQLSPGSFSVRWTGELEPEFSETYTISVLCSDGVRLWIDGTRVIDDWVAHPPVERSVSLNLTAGRRYRIKLEYLSGYSHNGPSLVKLFWSSASRPKEVIPQARFHSEAGDGDVTLPYLQQTFHQPLADLPAACDFVEKQVRTVRIVIEVLRSYLGKSDAPEWYLREAYNRLLRELGTSYEEIRAARGAPKEVLVALSERLGFDLVPPSQAPGPIDAIFLDPQAAAPNKLDEDTLEALFGLRSTTKPPLDPDAPPLIARWRLAHLRRKWKTSDWSGSPAYEIPYIDPDVIGPSDITNPVSTDPAYKLWDQRRKWVNDRILVRQSAHEAGNSLDAILSDPFIGLIDYSGGGAGTPLATLLGLAAQQEQGTDITLRLADLTLSRTEFEYLVSVARLDANPNGVVLPDEWAGVWEIVTNAEKRRQLSSWRQAEKQAGIYLGPQFFKLREPGSGSPTPGPWLGDADARGRWLRVLRPRVEQEEAIEPAINRSIDEVEEAVLPRLRDWLVYSLGGIATGATAISKDDWNWVTRRLQIDAGVGGCDKTTRVEQAIETIQGVLFGARNGLLEDEILALDAPDFDREWRWLGSFSSWRAAMLVFIYPENTLRPSLRRRRTPAFDAMLDRLRSRFGVSAKDALAEAAEYAKYFTDVSTLEFAALAATSGPYPSEGRDPDAPPGPTVPYWLILARASSGKFYACADSRRPDIGTWSNPDRTFWREIPKLDAASEIAAIFPYQEGGRGLIAVYGRSFRDGAPVSYFAKYDSGSWGEAAEGDPPDPLVCAEKEERGSVRSDPAAAARGVQEWSLSGNERLIRADVDGDGAKEIVLIDGGRIGILRGSEGGLVVMAQGTMPAGWQVPSTQGIVLRTEVTLTPNRRERLLVTNFGTSEIGLLGLRTDGSIGLIWSSSGSNIRRPNGTAGWSINFTDRPVTEGSGNQQANLQLAFHQLVSFNVDWEDRSELLATERVGPPGGKVTRLRVHIFRVSDTGITFDRSLPEIDLPGEYPKEKAHWKNWGPLTPYRNGLAAVIERDLYTTIYEQPLGSDFALVLLQWDRYAGSFSAETFPDDITTADGQMTWAFAQTDRFLPLDADSGDKILLTTASGKATGMLERKSSFGLAWGDDSEISSLWTRAATDDFVAADVDGDGVQEVIGFTRDASATEQKAGVFKWADGQLGPSAILSRRIDRPGGIGTTGWNLDGTSRYLSADVDGDGVDEIVVLTTASSGAPRLGLLRGFRRPRGAYEQGVKSRYGPASVSLRTIEPKYSDPQIAARRARIADAYDSNLWPTSPNHADVIYLDEAYFHVPMELALRLADAGDYLGALDWFGSLYDYSQPLTRRKVWAGLVREETFSLSFERALEWLRDPLDPHAIAATRPNTYTRATIVQIVRTILAYADSEFSKARSETVARALQLYLAALELLDAPEVRQAKDACQEILEGLRIQIGEDEWMSIWHDLIDVLGSLKEQGVILQVAERLREVLSKEEHAAIQVDKGRRIIERAVKADSTAPQTMEKVLAANAQTWSEAEGQALMSRDLVAASSSIGRLASLGVKERATNEIPLFGENGGSSGVVPDDPSKGAYSFLGTDVDGRRGYYSHAFFPAPSFVFCVPPNSVADALRRHAQLNIQKIRSCRNIGGMEAHLEPYGGVTLADAGGADVLPTARDTTLQPLPYRFPMLIERANNLANLAAQIESSMLASIEKRDATEYDQLRARHDLALARAGIRLRELQLGEAIDEIGSAQLQRDRALLQQSHYRRLLKAGLSAYEVAGVAAAAQGVALKFAAIYSIETIIEWAGTSASAMESLGQLLLTGATFERREQEWRQQRWLAEQDVRIGEGQIRLARERALIAGQERTVSELQYDAAEAALDFIANKKFANVELYDWMSGVLEGIYRFFLQQATGMALLAQNQLAFERQQLPPAFIQEDYWQPSSPPPSDAADEATDRRGLTGSARLLRDIVQLDQYAFRTDQRKLQLSKTISLADLDPIAFQEFRETGVVRFATPMEMFERDFPDHYLRLIKRVRTSVIGLIPPTRGLHATLSAVGTSRAVIGGETFRTVTIQRGPESVALTSPRNATGLFELDPQPEMLVPFEGIGVDTLWELSMPKAANLFDFSTVADVLLTLDYTALRSTDYGAEVIERLDPLFSADRPFSLRHEFQDEWFYIHNPDQSDRPMTIEFETTSGDFPPNVDDLEIQHVALYFSSASGDPPASWANDLETTLAFDPDDGPVVNLPTAAKPVNGLIATRRAAGAVWTPVLGQSATGKWTLTLPNTAATKKIFGEERLDDVLFVVTYRGTLPPWPS
ncbi:MAG: PA14 domain-containing protein [Gaiellaceae bacterium]